MSAASFLPLLPASPERFAWRGHQIATYRAGAGRPILLVHSINAAASAFEMRGPFAALQGDGEVHAMDLLGYGNSDRPARRYAAEDYIDQIGAQLARIGAPTAVVASSLGAAYAVAAADRWPERVRSLVLACPVGISQLARPAGPVAWAIYRILRGPVGRQIFRWLTSESGTRYFLNRQAYHDPASVTPETLAGFYTSAQRPGGYYAPICFLTGLLNCDIAAAFARLRQPTLIIWGKQATTTPPQKAADFLNANPRARLKVIDGAGMLVQDERPAEFALLARDFIAG
ncbi:alpha/beta fold hydrolase [Oscillochloris sp. ZM17-4]|uniref:alpha/beta fold hydrolase n=1 Tax=Oscillochloris sp. ZM17-4 TaxID=2866714 RepID=UPI001C73CB29|nr:alpha/beta fold hydrolase [Oscillochloris sp. ZM17-4]MBX0329874.1 alpha/beta fold hydrolase [Oscillochloris sp. ZM17-4]